MFGVTMIGMVSDFFFKYFIFQHFYHKNELINKKNKNNFSIRQRLY